MLTRLKVNGFKNLADVDVSFGPFTCVAGANGVGKSNLFDAIVFLAALADRPLMDAARSVRDEANRATDVRSLFLKLGEEQRRDSGSDKPHVDEMSFEAEMLIPPRGHDDLGQAAAATITFLRYKLTLGYRWDEQARPAERLEVRHEELSHINLSDASKHLRFPHRLAWRRSVLRGSRRGSPFLSTDNGHGQRVVKLHQDGKAGRPRELSADLLPRTVLSSTNAVENPTALLARREMQSWKLLQLEPSALRKSDSYSAPTHIGADGSHVAATLHRLARIRGNGKGGHTKEAALYAMVANRLSQLVEDIREVKVDEDPQRELLTVQVMDRNRKLHAARALSDGTLRFLALAILELDPEAQGLLCLEEPENGIHPRRIEAMLRLLKDLAVDAWEESGPDNPLRQVIVNTHSPSVVALVDDDDLLVAEPNEAIVDRQRCRSVAFRWLPETWRHKAFPDIRTMSRGELIAYLDPLFTMDDAAQHSHQASSAVAVNPERNVKRKRVKDRKDLERLLFDK
jgi:predicted ATPase